MVAQVPEHTVQPTRVELGFIHKQKHQETRQSLVVQEETPSEAQQGINVGTRWAASKVYRLEISKNVTLKKTTKNFSIISF